MKHTSNVMRRAGKAAHSRLPGRIYSVGAVAVAAVAVGGLFAPSALAAPADQQSVTFKPTNSDVRWTVPAGVTSVNITAIGGAGGGEAGLGGGGGLGAKVTGVLPVEAGEVLTISVGGNGGSNEERGNREAVRGHSGPHAPVRETAGRRV